MEEVSTNKKNEIHQNTSVATANGLYKQYRKWFEKKYSQDKQPLSFKEWLGWAKQKNFIQSVNANGEETKGQDRKEINGSEQTRAPEEIKKKESTRAKKVKIAAFIIVAAAIAGVVVGVIKTKKSA